MAVKDLVSGVLAESITTSTTNILVTIAQSIGASGIQAFFPTPPFYITIMPKSPIVGVANRLDSEIIQVTAVGHDQVGNAALTGVRAQRDTTAKPFSAGDIVTVGVYTDDAVLLGGTGTTETEIPWINTNDIIDDVVTDNKIDWDDISHAWRKVYDVTIAAASGTVNYDVPIDIVNNRRVAVYMSYEPSSGSISWSSAQVLNGSKSVVNTYQTGIECGGGAASGVFVNRGDFDQIIAWGNEAYMSAHAEIMLTRAATGNYVTYTAKGFGGGSVDNRRSQDFQGRIYQGSANVKYIRFKVINPQAGGSIVVMALK